MFSTESDANHMKKNIFLLKKIELPIFFRIFFFLICEANSALMLVQLILELMNQLGIEGIDRMILHRKRILWSENISISFTAPSLTVPLIEIV